MLKKYKDKVKKLKANIVALGVALRRKDVPWCAKAVTGAVVAYALSPIDLIPDFIPVLGLLDDMVLLPLGIVLAVKLIPDNIWGECKRITSDNSGEMKPNKIAAGMILLLWAVLLIVAGKAIYTAFA